MATVTRTQVTTVDQATGVTHAIAGVTVPAGKLAILRFGYQSDTVTISSVTDDAGNTWSVAVSVHSASGDNQTSAIAYLVVPAGGLSGATVTITLSATSTLAGHVAYFDSDTGWPSQATVLDKTSGLNTGLVTAWTSNATATTTQADELLVGVAYSGGAINGGTSTPGSGWTEENEQVLTNSGYELVTEWQKVTSTGAYAATGTWSAAEIAACCIATFKTAAAAATAPSPPSAMPLLLALNKYRKGFANFLGFPAPVPTPAVIATPVSNAVDAPFEALQGILQTASDPIDAAQGISTVATDPLEAIRGGITNTSLSPFESLQGILQSLVDALEATGGIASTGIDPLEALRGIAAPQSDPIESSTGLSTTSADPFEATQGIATTILVPFEATGGIAASALDPLEALGAVATALSDPYEAAGAALTAVSATSQAPYEALQGIARALGLPLEALGGIASTGTDPLESVAGIVVTSAEPFESLGSTVRALIVPFEAAGGIAQVAVVPLEALQTIISPRSDPFEVVVLLGPGVVGAFDEPHTRPPAARGADQTGAFEHPGPDAATVPAVLVVRVFDSPNPRRAP
jgi:hypothetical protein